MILMIVFLILGLIFIIKGADIFVDGIASIARYFKVSTFVIALTVVAFGTSAPELAISFTGIINGNDNLVFANVVGSSIVNILLILGIASIIHPIKVNNATVKKEIPMMVLMYSALVFLYMDNIFNPNMPKSLTRSDGMILILFFAGFIYYLFTIIKNSRENFDEENNKPVFSKFESVAYTIIGLIMIIIGSNLIVDNSVLIAESLNVSEKIISITIITIGTSLPEIIMSIVSVKKNEFDFTLGNIIGTNIFNIGIVLGLPILICGSIYPTTFNIVDMAVLLSSAVLLLLFASNDKTISRKECVHFIENVRANKKHTLSPYI